MNRIAPPGAVEARCQRIPKLPGGERRPNGPHCRSCGCLMPRIGICADCLRSARTILDIGLWDEPNQPREWRKAWRVAVEAVRKQR